jgi:transcriptional regulator with XRE-family HTH domain
VIKQTDDNLGLIGARIRQERKQKGLTLQEVSEKAGLSVSYLSQIENGRVNINISSLENISKVLETPLAIFFLEPAIPEISIVHMNERHWYPLGDNSFESLLIKSHKNLEVAVIHIEPGADTGQPSSHPGEEFSYISRGSVCMTINGQSFDLLEGDVIYYQSDMQHSWKNLGDAVAHVLIVNTPASY